MDYCMKGHHAQYTVIRLSLITCYLFDNHLYYTALQFCSLSPVCKTGSFSFMQFRKNMPRYTYPTFYTACFFSNFESHDVLCRTKPARSSILCSISKALTQRIESFNNTLINETVQSLVVCHRINRSPSVGTRKENSPCYFPISFP
jgi:hypothetical protein